jgi:hypothetical protein
LQEEHTAFRVATGPEYIFLGGFPELIDWFVAHHEFADVDEIDVLAHGDDPEDDGRNLRFQGGIDMDDASGWVFDDSRLSVDAVGEDVVFDGVGQADIVEECRTWVFEGDEMAAHEILSGGLVATPRAAVRG